MAASYRQTQTYNAPRDTLMRAVKFSLRRLPSKRVYEQESQTTIEVPMSFTSWGEVIEVRVTEGCEVSVFSKCFWSLQYMDWGKNKQNVQFIFDWIDDYLELTSGILSSGAKLKAEQDR